MKSLFKNFGGQKRPKKVLIVFPDGVNGRFTLPSGNILTLTTWSGEC